MKRSKLAQERTERASNKPLLLKIIKMETKTRILARRSPKKEVKTNKALLEVNYHQNRIARRVV